MPGSMHSTRSAYAPRLQAQELIRVEKSHMELALQHEVAIRERERGGGPHPACPRRQCRLRLVALRCVLFPAWRPVLLRAALPMGLCFWVF
jgi:hypothetical protein